MDPRRRARAAAPQFPARPLAPPPTTRESAASRLSPRQMRLIAAIAAEGSLHGAARALGTSQPAASMLLNAAESLLGQPLFARDRRGARPTRFGRTVIERLAVAMAELDLVALAARDQGRPLLRVGAIPRALQWLLPQAFARLLRAEPALHLSVREGPALALLDSLADGSLDAVVGREPPGSARTDPGALVVERLFEERTVVVEGTPVTSAAPPPRSPVPLVRLRDRDWVLPPPGSHGRALIDGAFLAAGLEPPRPRVESASYASNLAMAAEGGLLTLAPQSAARAPEFAGRIRALPVRPALPASPVCLVHRATSTHLGALRALRAALRAAADDAARAAASPVAADHPLRV